MLADAYHSLGDDDAADLELDAADIVFRRLGAHWDARTVGEKRAGSGGHAGLTPREVEVLRLMAAGQSNRQIANSLFITVKAVEWHLGNVYRKLGVRGRKELSGALAQPHTT